MNEYERTQLPPLVSFSRAIKILHSSHSRLKKAQALGHFNAVLINRRWAIPKNEILRLLGERDSKAE
jgi:hypothetical protein